jgi:hypothetical protein
MQGLTHAARRIQYSSKAHAFSAALQCSQASKAQHWKVAPSHGLGQMRRKSHVMNFCLYV